MAPDDLDKSSPPREMTAQGPKLTENDFLAARIFLLLHDQFSGRPTVANHILEDGVATARLAQLLLTDQLTLSNNRLLPGAPMFDRHGASADPEGDRIVDTARQHGGSTAQDMIRQLAPSITRAVAARLVSSGLVRRRSRPLRRPHYPRVDQQDLSVNLRDRLVAPPSTMACCNDMENAILGVLSEVQALEVMVPCRHELNAIYDRLAPAHQHLVVSLVGVLMRHSVGAHPLV